MKRWNDDGNIAGLTRRTTDRVAAVAAVAVLVGVPWLLYARSLALWFTNDDPMVLAHVLRHKLSTYWSMPAVWQEANRLYFTPLLNTSFQLDLAVFGLDARAFHAHQLLAMGVAAALFFLVLRRFVPTVWAFAGGLLLLVGPMAPGCAEYLVWRHYLEGFIFACLASLATFAALDQDLRRLLPASLLLLGALAAKETYLPLALAFAFVPIGTARRRTASVIVLVAVTIGFLCYRTVMLGGIGSSYRPDADLAANLGVLAHQLGPSLFGRIDGVLFCLLGLGALATRPRAAAAWCAVFLLALAPVVPVAMAIPMASRYLLLPWAVICGVVAWSAAEMRNGRWRFVSMALLVALFAAVALRSRSIFRTTYPLVSREGQELRFYFESVRPGDVLLRPAAPSWAFDGLASVRLALTGHRPSALPIFDEFPLCEGEPPTRLLSYRDGEIRDITAEIPRLREAACTKVREVPLTGRLSVDGWRLSWELGPYLQGTYSILLRPAIRFDVPPSGVFQLTWLPVHETLSARIRYESPEGWVAYSPWRDQALRDDHAEVRW